MVRYQVVHHSTYHLASPQRGLSLRAQLRPRSSLTQQLCFFQLLCRPEPSRRADERDDDGNLRTLLSFDEPLQRLRVSALSEVLLSPASPKLLQQPWEMARASRHRYLGSSPRIDVDALRPLASSIFSPDRPMSEVLAALHHTLHHALRYDPKAASPARGALAALSAGCGVCQDFAHLTIGCLRAMDIPARYVGGYSTASVPPDQRLHAWVGIRLAKGCWYDLDPTPQQLGTAHHITVAWGRDRADVSPIEGLSGASTELRIHVDLQRGVGERSLRPPATS